MTYNLPGYMVEEIFTPSENVYISVSALRYALRTKTVVTVFVE